VSLTTRAAVVALVLSLALVLAGRASADPPLTLEQARKAAMTNYANSLAAAAKSNSCSWKAGPAYTPVPHDSPAAAYTRCMFDGSHMSSDLRHCLVAAGITAGGVAIGGIIGGAAARAIAGGIVGGGSAACASQLAL
jgi:hypothetical protein